MTNPTDKELREAAEQLVAIVMDQCSGYLSGPGFEAAQAARKLRDLLAAHALRPATALPPIHGNGAEDDTQALQARVNLAAATARPSAYLTRDGFPVGLEESVEEHAEPLYRGAAQQEALVLYPDDLGILRDAKGLSERCHELAQRLVRQHIQMTAPPAAPGVPEPQKLLPDSGPGDAAFVKGWNACRAAMLAAAASPSAP